MKLAKYVVIALVVLPLAGCSSQPAADPNAKLQPAPAITPQAAATVPPERQAEVQAQAEAQRAQGEAYARQMEEKFKPHK